MKNAFVNYVQSGTHYFVNAQEASASPARCRECHARLAWIVTSGGKKMPLDLDAAEQADNGQLKCVSHFATCKQAGKFRERPARPKSRCPVDGCERTVRRDELMCSTCWPLVPKRMRDEVKSAWTVCSTSKDRDDIRRYRNAAGAAVTSVLAARANQSVRQIDAFDTNRTSDPG